jgi:hypothetical protein
MRGDRNFALTTSPCVQVITDAGHRDITTVNGIGGYQSFFAWSFEATNKVKWRKPIDMVYCLYVSRGCANVTWLRHL